MIHQLKTLPTFFKAVQEEAKTFEIRKKDRGFAVGDYLALNEYTADSVYTGRCMLVRIIYILDNPYYCKEEFVTMAITPCRISDKHDLIKCVDSPMGGYGIPAYGRVEEEHDEQ